MRGKALEAQATQDGQFGEMKNAIGLSHKDDNLVTIFLFESLSKACRSFSAQQRRTQADTPLRLLGRGRGLLGLPEAKGGREPYHQQGEVNMHDDRRLGFLGKPA